MAERNSDALDSGGFGKDYHGQDAFGERIGGTGIGGNHFGGKAAGDFSGADELGEGHFTERYTDYGQATQTEAPDTSAFEGEANEVADSMRESIRDVNEETAENSNTGSTIDTSFQIGGIEEDFEKHQKEWDKNEYDEADLEDKEKYQDELERAEEELNDTKEWANQMKSAIDKTNVDASAAIDQLDNKSILGKFGNAWMGTKDKVIDTLKGFASSIEYDEFDINKIEDDYKERGAEAYRDALKELVERGKKSVDTKLKGAQGRRDHFKSIVDKLKSSTTDKTKTSFTDKMKPSSEAKPTEAKPGPNMSSAKISRSDYLTKANKDSTKEIAPNRNDFGNHAMDTLKGVTDRIADNTTAKALGIQSLEDFAKENGYNPNKLSTMKAYQSYQNKQIMKAVPGILKQIGSYITERVKDAVNPSQLPERIRNTLARYNIATLIGAAILSINSGAGLQASLDQALTMVDEEDKAAVSDYLEDVLNDEGTVTDLSNAFDDALAPEQNSASNELDESIVNVGRKDNTDYSGFNAGLGTTSDADVKVFIARNVKADPILRRMVEKLGK